VIATSQPNLGTRTKPGGNVFRQNGRYDINSSASSRVIPAFGNTIANARISGSVDFTGMGSSVAMPQSNPLPVAVLQSEPAELSQSADKEARTTTANR